MKEQHQPKIEIEWAIGTIRDGMSFPKIPKAGQVYEVVDPCSSKPWAGADDSWRGKFRSAWERLKHWLNDKALP